MTKTIENLKPAQRGRNIRRSQNQIGYRKINRQPLGLRQNPDAKFIAQDKNKEQLFACNYCSKISNNQSNILAHTRTHTQDKRFKCKYCPRSFVSSVNRIDHERRHLQIRPFKCDLCERSFYRDYMKRYHLLNKHFYSKDYKSNNTPIKIFKVIKTKKGNYQQSKKPYANIKIFCNNSQQIGQQLFQIEYNNTHPTQQQNLENIQSQNYKHKLNLKSLSSINDNHSKSPKVMINDESDYNATDDANFWKMIESQNTIQLPSIFTQNRTNIKTTIDNSQLNDNLCHSTINNLTLTYCSQFDRKSLHLKFKKVVDIDRILELMNKLDQCDDCNYFSRRNRYGSTLFNRLIDKQQDESNI